MIGFVPCTLFLVLTISSISLSFIYNLPQSRARGQNLWMSRPIFCRILWRCANCFLNFKCDLPEIFCFQELDWSAAKLESEVSFLWTLLQTLSNVLLSITMLTCSSISIYICVATTILKLSPGIRMSSARGEKKKEEDSDEDLDRDIEANLVRRIVLIILVCSLSTLINTISRSSDFGLRWHPTRFLGWDERTKC